MQREVIELPCGGIYPAKLDWKFLPGDQKGCHVCRKPPGETAYVYFCEEWDCWVHKGCVHRFLETKDGKLVLEHKHRILLLEEGDP